MRVLRFGFLIAFEFSRSKFVDSSEDDSTCAAGDGEFAVTASVEFGLSLASDEVFEGRPRLTLLATVASDLMKAGLQRVQE